ncbi:putative ubiquitin [Lausannevirus]|uniref:Putative ubiquitin n=1 Tax=Lausannevirus TaxID=999883 RepID=F2WLJ1_9VIRU|nr:putative ubiquitin [Lausannevirus]AEA07114.1 putative ubiquitin [Lausannevirus]
MQLFVKCYVLPPRDDGSVRTITIDIDGDRTIEVLKCMIWEKTGVLPSRQKLYCGGKMGFLGAAKIRDVFIKESTIFLV